MDKMEQADRQRAFMFGDGDETGERLGAAVRQRSNLPCHAATTGHKATIADFDTDVEKENRIRMVSVEADGEESTAIAMGTQVRDGVEESAMSRRKATARELMAVLQLQQFRCALTGEPLTPESARLDHRVPVSQAGGHDANNMQWVTENVNRAKGVMSQGVFVALCKQVTDWVSRQQTLP